MASAAPLMPFLRPLALPSPATVRHFLRFSTTSRCREEAAQVVKAEGQIHRQTPHETNPNLAASRAVSPVYPPPHMTSLPRPKKSRASHRTNHPRPIRPYPTRHRTHHPVERQKLTADPVALLPAEECAPNLPYFVSRSRNNELPVYFETKRGGSLKQTRIKNVDGNPQALRDALSQYLGLEEKGAVVNPVNKHIVLKGSHKPLVEKFLRERMF
ncbi:Mitochondrial large subunit ribosomal protein (Img2) [Teratosphaeria destructans]|uniref:Large ribosomal subunit protein mL49 n=1 Tax=Teratosphaeria destructans TaxID=418781 RepID=A0A9W7VZG3_9PEZI|nr:Mitochondrial large subunit ribosomal protein (Img2) [Teratosphaeria destructans]